MSIRQLMVAVGVASTLSVLAPAVRGEDRSFTGAAAGYAETSDFTDVQLGSDRSAPPQVGNAAGEQIAPGYCTQCSGTEGCEFQSGGDCGPDVCNVDSCSHCWHWTAGAEGTYLAANFHHDVQFGPGTEHILDLGWQAAPRIWLGVENCNGWGARARYWQLNAVRNRFGLAFDNITPGLIADFSQQLEMYDIDCEITRRIEVGNWNIVGSFGGRFGSLDRLFAGNSLLTLPPANSEFLSFETETNAGGLTGAVEFSTPIGNGGLEVFSTLRASPLWGSTVASVNARENNGGMASTFSDSARVNTQLTIWDAQVGLQCTKELASCQGTVFARCAFEYQSWNLSHLDEVTDPSVDLYGVAFAVGFTR